MIVDMEIEGKHLTLVNICGPNEDSPEFYRKIADITEKFGNETCILCGDFNLVQDHEIDTFAY